MITASDLTANPAIRHGFFTRRGGVSGGIYEGLNCGYGSGDNSADVDENRTRAMARFGLTRDQLNTVYQVHSADVAVTDEPWAIEGRPKVDAIVTNRPGLAIGIMTADCTPVLFADRKAGIIGAAHAGWKGAIGGVLAATVRKMEELGGDRHHITAAVGPCIHQKSYEVGPEFYRSFVDQHSQNDQYFTASPKDRHYLFDLPGFVLGKLSELDLSAVQNVSEDTYLNEDKFYSYRRTTHRKETDYGRGLSAIVLAGD